MQELSEMEREYQSTMASLFPTFGASAPMGANPFQRALMGSGGGFGATGDSESDGDSSGDSGGDTGGETGGDGGGDSGDTGGQDSSSGGNTDQGDGEEDSTHLYNYLLLGDFSGDGENLVSRAYQDEEGDFVLERGGEMSLFAPGIGLPSTFVTAGPGEMVLAADFTGDGWDDILTVRSEGIGTAVKGWERTGLVGLELRVKAFFPYRAVRSAALFNFDSDAPVELCVLFDGEGDLTIYDLEGDSLRYLREVVLPFEPTLVVSTTDEGVFNHHYLHILEETGLKSISFSSRYPGIYSFGRPPSYVREELFVLDGVEKDAGDVFRLLHYRDLVAIVQVEADRPRFWGSFGTSYRFPVVLLGTFAEDEGSQLFFWP
jgi:hypothetical protein